MSRAKSPLRTLSIVAGTILLLCGSFGSSHALPITSITDLNNFRDTRSLNDVGMNQGDSIQYGAQVLPNDAAGTRMAATQGTFRKPVSGFAPCGAFTANPNMCVNSVPFAPSLIGPWNLTFVNGPDSATATTPALTSAAAAAAAPFPVSVTISGTGTQPNLSWTVPAGFTPGAVRINVFEKNKKNSQGVSDIIWSGTFSGSTTSFTVPSTANLTSGTAYVLNVQLIETKDGTSSTGSPNSNISRRSSSFFDFTPLKDGAPPQVLLPTVGPAPDPSSGFGSTYQFNVAGIVAGAAIFIDPYVAIGYDYATGPGDPNFASVMLPAVQSDPFLLSFLGEPGGFPVSLLAGQWYTFPTGGVDHFSIRGINIGANLDPGDVTAFITGLTFTGNGSFTGTMTPVLEPVPEPGTMMLLGSGLAGLVGYGRRRLKKQLPQG